MKEALVPQGWSVQKLEELLVSKHDLTYGIVQPGPPTPGGIPIVRVRDIHDGRVHMDEPMEVAPSVEASYRRSRLQGGELLVTLVGTVGNAAVVGSELAGWNVARAVAVARVRPEIGARWITWVLKLAGSVNMIAERVNTTVQTTLNLADLRQLPVLIPPTDERRGIAATLAALDDKIESNRRLIDIAERLGDALFSSVSLMPTPLSDVALLVMGSSPPGSSYNETGAGLPFYQGVRDFGRRYPRRRIWTTNPVRIAQGNDTLVSVRAPVGDLNRATEECCVGRGVGAVRSSHPSTIYYALRAASDLWEPFQQEGTVFGAINKGDLAAARIAWPLSTDRERLEAQLAALDARIYSLIAESDRLIGLRDALLPELLSGRIRVPEAAEVFQEAVG